MHASWKRLKIQPKIDTANQNKRLNWKGKLKAKIKNKNEI